MEKGYRLLRQLTGETSAPGKAGIASTVQALAFYCDLPCIVTIESAGGTLRNAYSKHARVLGDPVTRALLLSRASLCGHWLADFHVRTTVGAGDFDIDELLSYCRVRVALLCEQHPDILDETAAHALEAAARRLAANISPGSQRISGRHNDFASHNIIACEDGGVRVLDFMAFDHGSNAFDVCNFWFELELLKLDPTFSNSLLSQMQSAFLDGYGLIDPEQPDFQLARLRYTINRLLNELSSLSPWRRASIRWYRITRELRAWLLRFGAAMN